MSQNNWSWPALPSSTATNYGTPRRSVPKPWSPGSISQSPYDPAVVYPFSELEDAMRFGVDAGSMAGGLYSLGRRAVQGMRGMPAVARALSNELDSAVPYIDNIRKSRPIRRLSDQLKQDRRLAKRTDYVQQVFDKDAGVGNQVFRRSMEKSPEYQDYIGRQTGNDNLRMDAYLKSSPRPNMTPEDINMDYVHANYKGKMPGSLQRERAAAAYNSDPFFREYYHGGFKRAAEAEKAAKKAVEDAARRKWFMNKKKGVSQPSYSEAVLGKAKERMDYDPMFTPGYNQMKQGNKELTDIINQTNKPPFMLNWLERDLIGRSTTGGMDELRMVAGDTPDEMLRNAIRKVASQKKYAGKSMWEMMDQEPSLRPSRN